MRITGGSLKGRSVRCPPGEIRPAMDRMRESLFAILGSIDGAHFLDLFSGSGVVALEACSRGATAVTAVERDRGKRSILEGNLALCAQKVEIYTAPVERYLLRAREPFDFIFCDPPFRYRYKTDLLAKIGASKACGPDTVVLIHHPRSEEVSENPGALRRTRVQLYGGSQVSFYGNARDR